MRRYSQILCLVMIAALAGCGHDNDVTTPEPLGQPTRVTDLRIGLRTDSTLTLSWTAPAAGGKRVARYHVWTSPTPFRDDGVDQRTSIPYPGIPREPGAAESLTLAGLPAASAHYFALESAGEDSGRSDLSNVVFGVTTGIRRLTVMDRWNEQPAWSPDASKIAFGGPTGLYVVPTAGGEPTLLSSAIVSSPSWAHSGLELVLVWRLPSDRWVLAVVSAQGGDPTPIDMPYLPCGLPSLSPDDSTIIFVCGDFISTIATVPRAGGSSSGVCIGTAPSWAPDGERIVYYSSIPEATGMWVRSLAGGDPLLLAGGNAMPGSFSPDGRWVVYIVHGTMGQIRIVPSGGGDSFEVALPPYVGSPCMVAWSPDGQRLALTNYSGEIWIKTLDPGRQGGGLP